MGDQVEPPIPESYVVAERLLAGEYPGAADPDAAERRLRAFAEGGVTTFVDLTHPADALAPYEHLLGRDANRSPHPIVDLGTTTVPHMTRILDDVDAAVGDGCAVYVHCWGGIGRTGTVVGVLARSAWPGRRRCGAHDRPTAARHTGCMGRIAQTAAQRAMVTEWKPGRRPDSSMSRSAARGVTHSTLHGDDHWRCVAATGLALAPWLGDVDRTLVFCFGLLHDTRRRTDSFDPSTALARRRSRTSCAKRRARPRRRTIREPHGGARRPRERLVSTDPTIGTCWDADRLHLPRVGIRPRRELVSTEAAWGEAPAAAAELLRTAGAPSWETLVVVRDAASLTAAAPHASETRGNTSDTKSRQSTSTGLRARSPHARPRREPRRGAVAFHRPTGATQRLVRSARRIRARLGGAPGRTR